MALAFLLLFCSSVSAEKRKKREVQPVKLTLPLYYQTDYDQPIFTWKDRAITVAEWQPLSTGRPERGSMMCP